MTPLRLHCCEKLHPLQIFVSLITFVCSFITSAAFCLFASLDLFKVIFTNHHFSQPFLLPRIEQANPSNQLASCHLGILEGLVAGRPSNTGWRWDSSRYPAVATRAVQHAPAIQSTVGNALVTWRFTKGGKCNPWGWDRHNIEKQPGEMI